MNRNLLARSALGVATGLLLGLYTAILPVAAIVVTLVLGAMTALAVRTRDTNRGLALAGTLTGVGLVLLVAAANTVLQCSTSDNFCGNANVVPLAVYAGGLVAAGAAVTTHVVRHAHTQK